MDPFWLFEGFSNHLNKWMVDCNLLISCNSEATRKGYLLSLIFVSEKCTSFHWLPHVFVLSTNLPSDESARWTENLAFEPWVSCKLATPFPRFTDGRFIGEQQPLRCMVYKRWPSTDESFSLPSQRNAIGGIERCDVSRRRIFRKMTEYHTTYWTSTFVSLHDSMESIVCVPGTCVLRVRTWVTQAEWHHRAGVPRLEWYRKLYRYGTSCPESSIRKYPTEF